MEQLQAACSEAKAQGLRTLVHAQAADAALASAKAGCTEVEHGTYVDAEGLKYMLDFAGGKPIGGSWSPVAPLAGGGGAAVVARAVELSCFDVLAR